jgi:hypothetical protein
LRSTIAQHDYRDRNIEIADDEIFISDGSKCDCGYILDILGDQNKVAPDQFIGLCRYKRDGRPQAGQEGW